MISPTKRLSLALATLCLVVTTAQAQVITTDPTLPPKNPVGGGRVAYLTPAQVHAMYTGPGLTAILSQVQHSFFRNITVTPSGNNEIEHFDSTVTGLVSINGGSNTPIQLDGPVSVVSLGKNGQTTGTFNTQMTELSLSGTLGAQSVMIRQDPTTPTTGQTTITDIGGGLFRITSFFDVFTDLSLDGGLTWIPQNNPATHVVAGVVPEPSPLLMGGAAALALAIGSIRRRLAD